MLIIYGDGMMLNYMAAVISFPGWFGKVPEELLSASQGGSPLPGERLGQQLSPSLTASKAF